MSEEKWEEGYKIVETICGKLYSFTMQTRPTAYRKKATTVPKIGYGPLAVFDTLENALRFIGYPDVGPVARHAEIWRCRYVPSKGTELFHPDFFSKTLQRTLPLRACPKGTRLADKVFLIERVKKLSDMLEEKIEK